MGDERIRLNVIFGHIHLESGFRREGDKLVGWGKATHYDRAGRVVSVKQSDTGIVLENAHVLDVVRHG